MYLDWLSVVIQRKLHDMIVAIIKIVNSDEFYNVSEAVDFAKGSRKLPKTWAEFKNFRKRNKWRTR